MSPLYSSVNMYNLASFTLPHNATTAVRWLGSPQFSSCQSFYSLLSQKLSPPPNIFYLYSSTNFNYFSLCCSFSIPYIPYPYPYPTAKCTAGNYYQLLSPANNKHPHTTAANSRNSHFSFANSFRSPAIVDALTPSTYSNPIQSANITMQLIPAHIRYYTR